MPPSFVGRAAEVETLAATIGLPLRTSGPAVAMVIGPPGAGKSRLLAEACALVRSHRVIRIQGSAPEQHVQLSAASDMLDLISRSSDEGAALSSLLAGPTQEDSVITPVRMLEATLRGVAALGPVLLVIDDFHWLDDTTIALAHYLVRGSKSGRVPLAMLLASRPGPATSAFLVALLHLLGKENLQEIHLAPLDRAAGLRLVKELSPTSTDQIAELIWERAEGSPFWIERLTDRDAPVVGDAPAFLKNSIESLSADSLHCLACVAIADRPLTIGELEQILKWKSAPVRKAIAEAAGLLLETMSTVRTAHDLIRQAVVAFAPDELQRTVNRQLATWLEAADVAVGRSGLQALEHRLAGGLSVAEAALNLTKAPASRSLGQSGIRRVFDISGELPLADSELARAIAVRAGEVGDHVLALELWSHLASLQGELGAAAAALAASEAALVLRLDADAWRFLGEARRLSKADDVLAVELDAQESALHRWIDRNVDEAVNVAERALAGASDFDNLRGVSSRRPYLRATLAAADAAVDVRRPSQNA